MLSCINVYQNSPRYFNISKCHNAKEKKKNVERSYDYGNHRFNSILALESFIRDKPPRYKSYRRLDFEPRPNNIIRLILPRLIYLLLKITL